jgi:diguanylate cyclase (GGDEF)-like protein/PAS domain S-box-containing protein
MPRLRIIIVEDEERIANSLRKQLGGQAFDIVSIAASCDYAVKLADSLRPDVVLIDIILEGKLEGIEAAAYIREFLNIPVIFLTHCAGQANDARLRPDQSCTYLLKPVTESELRLAIKATHYRTETARETTSNDERNVVAGTWEWEANSRELHCSDAAREIFGLDAENPVLGYEQLMALVHPHDRPIVIQALQNSLNHKRHFDIYHRIQHPAGSEKYIHQRGSVITTDRGIVRGIVGTTQDVTELRYAENRLWNHAHHDPLCNLPNRSLVLDRLRQGICHAHRERKQFAAMVFDIDNFGLVNDSLGHTCGDHLLAKVALRLKDCVRECDTVGRIGGNRFLLLFGGLASESDASLVADKLVAAMTPPFTVDGNEIVISTSIGIALYPTNASDPDELVNHAECAMHQAKQHENHVYQFVY